MSTSVNYTSRISTIPTGVAISKKGEPIATIATAIEIDEQPSQGTTVSKIAEPPAAIVIIAAAIAIETATVIAERMIVVDERTIRRIVPLHIQHTLINPTRNRTNRHPTTSPKRTRKLTFTRFKSFNQLPPLPQETVEIIDHRIIYDSRCDLAPTGHHSKSVMILTTQCPLSIELS